VGYEPVVPRIPLLILHQLHAPLDISADSPPPVFMAAARPSTTRRPRGVESMTVRHLPPRGCAKHPAQCFASHHLNAQRHVFVLGGPGAGKGTMCELAEIRLGWTHLSTVDLLHAEQEAGGPTTEVIREYIAAGKLVPNEIVVRLLKDAMERITRTTGDDLLRVSLGRARGAHHGPRPLLRPRGRQPRGDAGAVRHLPGP
jgi:hypothetical protein